MILLSQRIIENTPMVLKLHLKKWILFLISWVDYLALVDSNMATTIPLILGRLDDTITGKEGLLNQYKSARTLFVQESPEYRVYSFVIEFLYININELKRIKEDLELL